MRLRFIAYAVLLSSGIAQAANTPALLTLAECKLGLTFFSCDLY